MMKRIITFGLAMFCIINVHAMTEQKKADESSSGPSSAGPSSAGRSKQKFVPTKFTEEKLLDVYFACVDDKEGKQAKQHVQDFKIFEPSIKNRLVVMPLFVQAIYDEVIHVLPILFQVFPDVKDMTNNDGLQVGHYAAVVNNKAICDLCKQHGVNIDDSETFQQKVALAKDKINMHAKDAWGRESNKGSLKAVLMQYKYTGQNLDESGMAELRQRMQDSIDESRQRRQERGEVDNHDTAGDDDAHEDAQGAGDGGLAAKFAQLCTVQ